MVRIAILALILAGCAKVPERIVETQEVRVPIPVRREPPPELMAPYVPEKLPEWVSPSDPAASSALTREGEVRLKELVLDLLNRLEAWESWSR